MVSFTICILFPSNHEFAKGQAATGNQSLAIDPTLLTSSDARPQYQFPLNKPFGVAPLPPTAPSSSTLANPAHPTQASSNVDQHNFSVHCFQAVQELPGEHTQKASKRPNKMRVSKHSTTPRNLCAKEWVEQYHGTVEEFAAYFNALSAEELEVCSPEISLCLSEFTFHLALQGPFEVPCKRASRLSLSVGSRGIRDALKSVQTSWNILHMLLCHCF